MDTLEVNGTLNHLTQPPFVLTDLSQTLSSQGILLQPKSEQEVMQAFKNMLIKRECLLDYQHLRMLQGGIELDFFVVSSLPLERLAANGKQNRATNLAPSSDASQPSMHVEIQTEEGHHSMDKMIQEAISKIFQYKNFHKDSIMANSPLHNLFIVQQARQAFVRQEGLIKPILSERKRAIILREVLKRCLDEQLCPDFDKQPPKDLSKTPPHQRNQWIEYLILRRQYCERRRRKEVMQEFENRKYHITGGTYTRYSQTARERLAELIWQKEKQAFQPKE